MKPLKEYLPFKKTELEIYKLKHSVASRLTYIWTIFAICYVSYASFGEIPVTNIRIIDQTIGFLFGIVVGSIMNFWFGSTKKEDDKKDEVNKVE